jgi:hypothetical protein
VFILGTLVGSLSSTVTNHFLNKRLLNTVIEAQKLTTDCLDTLKASEKNADFYRDAFERSNETLDTVFEVTDAMLIELHGDIVEMN